MLKNYIKIVLRNMKRQKLHAFINIAGLAVAFSCAILIIMWIVDELSFENFHAKKNQIYRVSMIDVDEWESEGSTVPYSLAPLLKREFPEILDFTRYQDRSWFESCVLKYEHNLFYEENLFLVDPSFFNIFTCKFLAGNPETALSDKNSIVLTRDMAVKYFGDENPIGKIIRFNNRLDLKVTGVIENVPRNSEFAFNCVVPIQNLGDDKLNSWSWETKSYVLLKEDVPVKDIQDKIAGTLNKHHPIEGLNLEVRIQHLEKIHLYYGSGDINLIYVFSLIVIFVLIIACINYMNLSTARFTKRIKEIGLRKVVGANRNMLVNQFLSESIIFALIAFILSIIMVTLILPIFNDIVDKQLNIFLWDNLGLYLGLIGLTIIVGLIAGSYPALFLSAFSPAKMFKYNNNSGIKTGWFKKALVIFQFTIAIVLIIATIFVYKQYNYMINKKLGFSQDHIVYLPMNQVFKDKHEILKNKLLENPGIKNVTFASSTPGRIGNVNPVEWEGKESSDNVFICFVVADHDYTKTFEMDIIEGRTFSKSHTNDISNFIINRQAVELMKLESPVGKQISYSGTDGVIIGVVEDFHNRPVYQEVNPLLITIDPGGYNYFWQYAFIKIQSSDIPQTIKYIETVCSEVAPNFPFEYKFLDETYNLLYQYVLRFGKIFHYFAFLAIFISCLGLFGLTTYTAESRIKEIGVRKILGASVGGIVYLLSRSFTKLIIIANLIAWPVAYWLVKKLMEYSVYHIEINVWVFLFAGALAIIIALVTMSYQAIRAGMSNPVDALKYE